MLAVLIAMAAFLVIHGRGKIRSLAVLPFVNRSADAENEFFSDGLSEELIHALSRLPGLRVASRTSAFRYRGHEIVKNMVPAARGVEELVALIKADGRWEEP